MLSGFFITKKGKNLLAKTHDGANIELTRAEIGSGDIPEGQLVTEVTSLYGKVKELPLGEVKVGSGKEVCIPVQLTNKGVLTSFLFKEIGVYAIDPDEGEILYLYGNTDVTGDVPDEVKSESEAQLDYLFNLLLNVDNATKVDVNVDNSLIYATLQNLSDMADTKVDKVAGKGLSTEDYTTAEKTKLAGIESGANKYIHPATHPVSMITGLGTAATKNVGTSEGNVVGVNSDGEIDSTLIGRLAHVGTDGYIAYPEGGQLNIRANIQTGMLKITLPVSWNYTMLKFKVSIYNYNDNTSVDYILSGYSYKADVGWTQTTAYCVSPWGTKLANLPVSFGHDGAKCAITIGTPTTIWDYPQVAISDVSVGFNNTSYDMWKSGWNLSFITEALPTVNMTISNTNIAYDVNHADSATKADKLKTPRSIALSGGATGTSTNFDGSANISIPVTGLDAGKLTTGLVPSARLSPDPGAYTINPKLGPSGVLYASLNQPTLAQIGAVESAFTNKIAFYPYEKVLCEISSDGGSTWVNDPDMTEGKWKTLISENGKGNTRFAPDKQYRITINSKSYCYLDAVYIYLSTVGNKASIRIEEYNNVSDEWFDVVAKTNVASGDPGHFWLHHATVPFNPNASNSAYYGKVRLTIIPTITPGCESKSIVLYDLRWYGSYPGTDHRTIYSWDGDKNVTFPAQLKASEVYDNNQRVYSPVNKPSASNVTGLGTAATKNTGTSLGNVPVIESSGKLPAAIIPADSSKQDKLTFDTAPKSGSTNPVTSGGVATALAGKANTSHSQGHDTITFNPEANSAYSVFPLDRGYVDTAGACRTAFMPAEAITVEYTQDNGKTWNVYGLTDVQKQGLFSMNRGCSVKLGGPNATAQTIGHGVRITVSPTDNRYALVDMLYCWFLTTATCKCNIERSTIGAKDTFRTIRSDVPVSGNSGPNSITFAPGTFGGSADQTSNNYSYRFTFMTTAIHPTITSVSTVTDLRLYGNMAWIMPNQMMLNGHLYSWDTAQNATFPAQLNAAGGTFSGKLVPNGGLAHAGTDGYIAYPSGGQYKATKNMTGMLKITLPVSWIMTMLKFNVSIFNNLTGTSVDYIIAAYNNSTIQEWASATAYCVSPSGRALSNLPVSFGHDGSKCAITIGTPATVWSHPQVVVSDVNSGYRNTNYDIWKSGWNLSFVTEALPTVSTTISNTNIFYLSESIGGSGTGQTWHAKDILGSGTTSTADDTAESGYSVTIDTTAKNLNGSTRKYKAPFGTYVAIFRVQASAVSDSTEKVKLEIWGSSAAIASRAVKLSDFSAASKWEYFKIPFETDSTSGRDIYPKVTCLNATGNVKVDNIVVVPNAFALM